MNQFQGKFLVCDMDGTLLNGKREVSQENKAALFDFVQRGGHFSVATGRDEDSVRRYLVDLPVTLPIIAYNGAEIFDYSSNSAIWHKYLDAGVYPVVVDLMSAFPDLGVEIYHESSIYVLRENEATNAHIKRDSFIPCHAPVDEITFPWKKIILAWGSEELKKIEAYLREKRTSYKFFYSQPDFIEILHPEASKGYALRELSARYGICRESIIAMGDNMNDLEMLQYAATGVAVSNAHPDLIAAADICCGHHDNSAVAEVINWMNRGFGTFMQK
jgi:Cof subfamily protein (haloacid dehalogenase superfamily)